ncbi:hypothetical protein ACOSP7_003237 [Xanthoceras sorbifolium]
MQEFLTKGLSRYIEEDQGMDFRHVLLCYSLMSACLAHKDMLKTERSEAEKRELCEELEATKRGGSGLYGEARCQSIAREGAGLEG